MKLTFQYAVPAGVRVNVRVRLSVWVRVNVRVKVRLGLGLIQVNVRVRDNIQLLWLDYKGQLQLDGGVQQQQVHDGGAEEGAYYRPGTSTAPGKGREGGRLHHNAVWAGLLMSGQGWNADPLPCWSLAGMECRSSCRCLIGLRLMLEKCFRFGKSRVI